MVLYRSRSNEEVRTVAPQRRAVLQCWLVTDCYHYCRDTAVSTCGARCGPYNRTWTEENCIRFLPREIIGSNPELRSIAKLVTNGSTYKRDTINYKVGKNGRIVLQTRRTLLHMIINSDADIFIMFNDRSTKFYRVIRIGLCVKFPIAQVSLRRCIHAHKNFTCEF